MHSPLRQDLSECPSFRTALGSSQIPPRWEWGSASGANAGRQQAGGREREPQTHRALLTMGASALSELLVVSLLLPDAGCVCGEGVCPRCSLLWRVWGCTSVPAGGGEFVSLSLLEGESMCVCLSLLQGLGVSPHPYQRRYVGVRMCLSVPAAGCGCGSLPCSRVCVCLWEGPVYPYACLLEV